MNKITFLFPGQGTQFVGMGKVFYENYAIVKKTFQEVVEVSGIDIVDVCFNGDTKKINDFNNMQLAILAVEVSMFRVYMEEYGVEPQFIAGHSLGEYAALVSSGAISLCDAIEILLKRGELVQRVIRQQIGHMTIVENCSAEIVEQCIQKANAVNSVYISCYNANNQIAISGYNDLLDEVEELLGDNGANCTPLLFSPPIHSRIMNGICKEFEDYICSFKFHDFRFPIISNYTGDVFSDKNQITYMLTNQLCHPVKFSTVNKVMNRYGINMTIEMSPRSLLSDFVKIDYPEVNTLCFGVKKDRLLMEKLFGNRTEICNKTSEFLGKCLSIIATSENKNNDKEEEKEVIKIYDWMKKLYDESLIDKKKLGIEDKNTYIEYLIKTLQIKKVEETEILEYIRGLVEETNSFYEKDEWIKGENWK
jgi:[acyl-carrier-protein] S-malonyltransferase